MLIKTADDRTHDIDTLKELLERPDVTEDIRKRINQDLKNIRAGVSGESEAAYEINFHFGDNIQNWAVLHDLRLECDGRVAQIDHLLVNRFLGFFVCESKHFSEGVGINAQGEFTAFYAGKPYGVPSPVEQNRRHIMVLQSVFKSGAVELPKRLLVTLQPVFHSFILVSKRARISRPKETVADLETVFKSDQIKTMIDRRLDAQNNPLLLTKVISPETLLNLCQALATQHRPIRQEWAAKFGLPSAPPPTSVVMEQAAASDPEAKHSKLSCAQCGTVIGINVAKFCWTHKNRFGGKTFCMGCQKLLQAM